MRSDPQHHARPFNADTDPNRMIPRTAYRLLGEKLGEVTAQRDACRRAFNRLDAAVTHHRKAHMPAGLYFADVPDEALWHAHAKVLETMGVSALESGEGQHA